MSTLTGHCQPLAGFRRPSEPRNFSRGGTKPKVHMAELIVKAAVKEALEDHNVSSDFYEALDDEVRELLEEAAERAEANDRKTVQPRDL